MPGSGEDPDRGSRKGLERKVTQPQGQGVIDALIVTYNSRRYICRCVRSLRKHVPQCRIHIVDNASTDGTRQLLRRLKPDSLTLNDENRYLSPVWNEFLKSAESEFVLLVNADVIIRNGACISRSLHALREDPSAAAAGRVGRACYDNIMRWIPRVRPGDVEVFRNLIERSLSDAESIDSATGGTRSWPFIDGALALLRRQHIISAGGFSEALPFYLNDTELSWRLQRAGLKLAAVWDYSDGSVWHRVEASSRPAPPGPRLRLYRMRKSLASRIRAAFGRGA